MIRRGAAEGSSFLEEEIAALKASGLLREPRLPPEGSIVLCSNDYLGLSALPLAGGAAGAGASALVAGYCDDHAEAEAALSQWLGAAACLLFASGYAANVGAVAALVGRGDLVLSDRLNHASIIDGCRLSGATIRVYDHCDAANAGAILARERGSHRRCLVTTESFFSMDGTLAPLRALEAVARAHGAMLMVDEAHALGVFGPAGRGRCAAEAVVPDVLVGTLGKALGLQGAFVAGSAPLRTFLWNRARSFVFSTALSPAIARSVPSRVAMVAEADAGRASLHALAEDLRRRLRTLGADVRGEGPIVAWVVGSPERAIAIQNELEARGLWVAAIRPPTVPPGTSRLRITTSAAHAALGERILEAVEAVARARVDR